MLQWDRDGEISSEPENPEHNDSRRGRETNRETGNYLPLDWARSEHPGESRDQVPGRGLFIGHSCESRHEGWEPACPAWIQENWK